MKLLLLFNKDEKIAILAENDKEIYKEKYKGGIDHVLRHIKDIHKEYVNNNCFETVKDNLIKTVNAIIKDILETTAREQAEIYSFLEDTISIIEEIEQKIPCAAVAAYLDESKYKLYLTIIPKSNKIHKNIFRIILTVNTENKIEFEITIGSLEFNKTKLISL